MQWQIAFLPINLIPLARKIPHGAFRHVTSPTHVHFHCVKEWATGCHSRSIGRVVISPDMQVVFRLLPSADTAPLENSVPGCILRSSSLDNSQSRPAGRCSPVASRYPFRWSYKGTGEGEHFSNMSLPLTSYPKQTPNMALSPHQSAYGPIQWPTLISNHCISKRTSF